MKQERQYVESLEEMVYKNRNKEYGSYQIRKKYRKFVLISTAIGLFLLGAIVAYPLVKSLIDEDMAKKRIIAQNVEADMKKLDAPPPPPPPPPPPADIVQQVKFVAPEATKDSTKVTREVAITIDEAGPSTPPPPEPTPTKEVIVEQPKQQTEEVFMVVEEMPQFEGDINSYLSKSIKYPVVAQENGIQGKVICQFVVNKDGSIVDIQVVRGVDPSLDKEAVRVIQNMPRWTPGKQRNQPVRVKYTLPISFKLQ
jgi:periplasmic protein TonB